MKMGKTRKTAKGMWEKHRQKVKNSIQEHVYLQFFQVYTSAKLQHLICANKYCNA